MIEQEYNTMRFEEENNTTKQDDVNRFALHKQMSSDTHTTFSMNSLSSSSLCHSVTQPLHLSSKDDNDDDINTYYEILPHIIGEGQYGTVRECIHKKTGTSYAVKTILKTSENFTQEEQQLLQREVDVMDYVDRHSGVISLMDVFEDNQCFHIVMELCHGGDLYEVIAARIALVQSKSLSLSSTTLFSEEYVASTIHSVLDTVAYLHDRDVAHRDLKPENLLVTKNNNDGSTEMKLIDFGLAVTHDDCYDAPMNETVGTPFYMAPEVLKKSYTKACDIWSIGVMTYIMLTGRPPFEGQDDDEIFASIRKGRFTLDGTGMSDNAKDFIKCLLKRDPRRRLTAESAMEHPWMAEQLAKNM